MNNCAWCDIGLHDGRSHAPRSNLATAPRPLVADRYRFWGSECSDCGNTTPGSMCCGECRTENYTKPLWITA